MGRNSCAQEPKFNHSTFHRTILLVTITLEMLMHPMIQGPVLDGINDAYNDHSRAVWSLYEATPELMDVESPGSGIMVF